MKFNNSKKSLFRLFLVCVCLISSLNTSVNAEEKADSKSKMEVAISKTDASKPLKLGLSAVLDLALKNNLNIAIKKDKSNESKLKLDEVKSKKLFLLFKFTNAKALEDSANYEYMAADSNLKATYNNVLTEATQKYYNLVQTLIAKRIAEEFLKQGSLSLEQNLELFKLGKATKFEVNQTEVFVENLKQKFLEAEIAYMLTSVDLAQYLNEKDLNINIIPEDCTVTKDNDSQEINISSLNLIPDDILLSECIAIALKTRPEVEELSYQIKSLEELKKAIKFDEIKVETLNSQISQLKKSLKLLKNATKTTVIQAVLKFVGSKNQIKVAEKRYKLSLKALEQARVTREEGIGTNKDILEAQVNLAQAKNDFIKSVISYNISQINLLKELGIIDIEVILNNIPVKLPAADNNDLIDLDRAVKNINNAAEDIIKSNTYNKNSNNNNINLKQ